MSMHNTGVTITSKLLIRGITSTAMGARTGRGSEQNHGLNLFRTSLQMDTCPAGGGFPMSHSQSWRRDFRWTRSSFLAPSRDARHRWGRCIAACPPRRWESARGPFSSATARRGGGVALRVLGRKAGCGSYPKGRRCIVPNVHGPRLARRLPAEHGASKTHAVYPGVCGTVRVRQLFRCAGVPMHRGLFRSATGRRTVGWLQGLFGRKAVSLVHTRRGEGPSFKMLGEPPRAGAGGDLKCGVPTLGKLCRDA